LRNSEIGDLAANVRTKSVVIKSSLRELVVAFVVLTITAVMVGSSLD
jgi:hypothetical protein